jgi:pilus assembly protein CpaC
VNEIPNSRQEARLALAGGADLIQNRVESQNRGIPGLADVPLLGRFFSRVEEKTNEVELLMIVTPELIAPLDPHQLPQCGPGQVTASPDDQELYCYGYLEVPKCGLAGPAPGPFGCEPLP